MTLIINIIKYFEIYIILTKFIFVLSIFSENFLTNSNLLSLLPVLQLIPNSRTVK